MLATESHEENCSYKAGVEVPKEMKLETRATSIFALYWGVLMTWSM